MSIVPPPASHSPSLAARLGCVAAVAVVYYLTGRLGLLLAEVGPNVTLFWPPTGVAVAALYRLGGWAWPGVFAGAVAVNLGLNPGWLAVGLAGGNTLAPLLAVALLRRGRFDPSFAGPRDLYLLVTAGAAVAMTVSAVNGTTWLYLGGLVPADRWAGVAARWWLGDLGGVILAAPPLLAWRGVGSDRGRRRLAGGLGVTALACLPVVTNLLPWPYPLFCLLLPAVALIWAGLAFPVAAAAGHVLLVAAAAAVGKAAGTGVFAHLPAGEQVYLLWGAVTTGGVATLLLATVLAQRDRADAHRRAVERKMLEAQRLEGLGVLAGGLAHDFNNLFTEVLGHAELAAAGAAPQSPAGRHLAQVTAGIGRAAHLTRQLLAYSGRGPFVVRPTSVAQAVKDTAGLLRAAVPKGVPLRLDVPAGLPAVAADAGGLAQLVVNLVANAGEAVGDRPGGVTVTAATGVYTAADLPASALFDPLPAGRYVALTVADTGVGMDGPTQARLFDPLFTTKFAGRGLGMPAVLGIVRAHKGGVRVYSTPGAGTTVTVFLPALSAGTDTPSPAARPTDGRRTVTATGGDTVVGSVGTANGETFADADPAADPPARPLILLVDDEAAVRRLAEMMLKKLGYEVTPVASGAAAVDAFRADPTAFRAVMLDLTMPGMSGADVLAAVRAVRPAVPVVLTSGYTAEAVPLLAGGPTRFLQKPFALADLRRALTEAITGPAPAAQPD